MAYHHKIKSKTLFKRLSHLKMYLKLQFLKFGFKKFLIVIIIFIFGLCFVNSRHEEDQQDVVYIHIKDEGLNETPTIKSEKSAEFGVQTEAFSVKERLQSAEVLWKKSVEAIDAYINSMGGLSKIDPWSVANSVYYWDFFTPSFNCPHLIQRVGGIGDGGKWVCGFELFEMDKDAECIVYSFGVANESSFEAEFLERTNCKIFAFDYTVDKLGFQINEESYLAKTRTKFYKTGLTNRDTNNDTLKTLGRIMRENGHEWIDFLKIDIEGAEFPCLEQIVAEFGSNLPFGQLQMEIHVDHFGRGFSSVYKWWRKLENHGLRAFSSETNHHSCVGVKSHPVAVEYSFLNVKNNHRIIQ